MEKPSFIATLIRGRAKYQPSSSFIGSMPGNACFVANAGNFGNGQRGMSENIL
jgi:hypothetical protein